MEATMCYQLRPSQLSAFRRHNKAAHALLGKMQTAVEDDLLDAIEEEQAALAESDKAVKEITEAGS